jgi:glycerol-3-phosphate dehydrogenase
VRRPLAGAARPARVGSVAFDRAEHLARLDGRFDVLVIGGGVTGAGVALDAAARGLRTAIVERDDWASGTSSRSSKLVHGGLRYLQQREYRLVYENLAERQRLLHNAPHLVTPLAFLIPLFGKGGIVDKTVAKAYSSSLRLYDLTGGVRIGKRYSRIPIDQVMRHLPTLHRELLAAGFLYWDAEADDARLTLELVRTAALEYGAVAVNHCAVVQLKKDARGHVEGVVLADGTHVAAAAVVNATGVWVDQVRALDEGTDPRSIRPAKGIHLVVARDRLPADIAAVLPVRKGRRSIFAVPWGDRVYLGTTDTEYDGPLDDPQVTPQDVAYILDALNGFITQPLDVNDVLGTWAGLRPLLHNAASDRTADLSRRHKVLVSSSGLVTITGGKLTTYRKMAQDTVDVVLAQLGRPRRKSPTKKLLLRGASGMDAARAAGASEHLVGRHGGEAIALLDMIGAEPSLAEPLVPTLPYLKAEALYAVRHEMAWTVTDVLSRRTRALLLARDASAGVAEDVAGLIAPELGWSAQQTAQQVTDYRALVQRELDSAHLPVTVLPASSEGTAR